jgi:hypothetical protein
MTDDAATVAALGTTDRSGPAAAETLRLYVRDWTAFETWCAAMRRTPLPADPAAVAAFLTEAAPSLSAGTLARRVSAVAPSAGIPRAMRAEPWPTSPGTASTVLLRRRAIGR